MHQTRFIQMGLPSKSKNELKKETSIWSSDSISTCNPQLKDLHPKQLYESYQTGKRCPIKTIDQIKHICGTTFRESVQPGDRGSREYPLIKRTTMIPKNLWDNILLHSRILKALQITFHVERVYTRKALSVTICILKLMKTRAF